MVLLMFSSPIILKQKSRTVMFDSSLSNSEHESGINLRKRVSFTSLITLLITAPLKGYPVQCERARRFEGLVQMLGRSGARKEG